MSGYAFDNNDPAAVDRHNILAEVLDELTISRLGGLGDLTGRRCLELGAGGGSIAGWLAERTGPSGRVLATDINTRHLRFDRGYQVLGHDLVTEPVPDGPWDLIHARLVLLHLPSRREILHRLVDTLAPGGTLLIEDFETTFGKSTLTAPTAQDAELIDTYHRALVEKVLPSHGNDPTWAGRVHAEMLDAGLAEVDTVVYARSSPGGSAGARLIATNIAQARADFLAAGMSAGQLRAVERLTSDPRVVVRTPLTYSTSGRKASRDMNPET
jgi:ubiquinone/menaquinone biosynthesis C-methylase UbiE